MALLRMEGRLLLSLIGPIRGGLSLPKIPSGLFRGTLECLSTLPMRGLLVVKSSEVLG